MLDWKIPRLEETETIYQKTEQVSTSREAADMENM